jgi:hypothetical protein
MKKTKKPKDHRRRRKTSRYRGRRSGVGHVVRRDWLFLVAPSPPCSLHVEKTIWIGEGGKSGFVSREISERIYFRERKGFFGIVITTTVLLVIKGELLLPHFVSSQY